MSDNLSAREQLIKLAKEKFNITYGLRFTIPDDIAYTKRNIGKYSIRVYDETPVGELILRRVITEAIEEAAKAQERYIWNKSAELFNEFADCFDSFEEAKNSLLGNIAERAAKNPQCIIYMQKISQDSTEFVQQITEELRTIKDLVFCFFLSLHTDKEWELEDLYTLGEKTSEDLGGFYSEVLGIKDNMEEASPEDADNDDVPIDGASDNKVVSGKSRGSKS